MNKALLMLSISLIFAARSMGQNISNRNIPDNSDNKTGIQTTPQLGENELPCNDFNGFNPEAGWVSQNVTANFTTANSDDGTTILVLEDNAGTSSYTNTTDYQNLGQVALGDCLCFDESLIQVSGSTGLPYLPRIYLTDGINQIRFIANTGITVDGFWHHYCAPIKHCNGTTLPSSPTGHWEMVTPGMTCSDFNNVIDNSTQLTLTVDVNSSPSEEVGYDNVCIENCHPCDPSFTYCANTNTPYTYTFTANDPNQNAFSWVINGVQIGVTPSINYTFPGSGTYDVCLNIDSCSYCLNLCINDNDPSGSHTSIQPINPLNHGMSHGQIVPNPTKNGWNIKFKASQAGNVSVKIFDPTGRTISTKNKKIFPGEQIIYQDATKLEPGIYFIEIKGAGIQFRSKAVKN